MSGLRRSMSSLPALLSCTALREFPMKASKKPCASACGRLILIRTSEKPLSAPSANTCRTTPMKLIPAGFSTRPPPPHRPPPPKHPFFFPPKKKGEGVPPPSSHQYENTFFFVFGGAEAPKHPKPIPSTTRKREAPPSKVVEGAEKKNKFF